MSRPGAVTDVVYVASYPKSGNTWFRAVYQAAMSGELPDINHLVLSTSVASRREVDDALGIPTSDLLDTELVALRAAAEREVLRRASGSRRPLRKVHDRLRLDDHSPPVIPCGTRAVYLVRDPRDVVVSFRHHVGASIERTIERLGDPASDLSLPGSLQVQVPQRLGSWSTHVESWLDQSEVDVHVVRYEDMVTCPVPTFAAALRFCGLSLDDSDVTAAIEAAAFERLRDQEAGHGFRERRPAASAPFFRLGRAGTWRDELDPLVADRIVTAHRAVMQRLGYLDDHLHPPGDRLATEHGGTS